MKSVDSAGNGFAVVRTARTVLFNGPRGKKVQICECDVCSAEPDFSPRLMAIGI
jgi:hypothetical protein